ncbi:MAG: hypothetical protein ACLT98_05395 [Eggerthellaceae bacterium]
MTKQVSRADGRACTAVSPISDEGGLDGGAPRPRRRCRARPMRCCGGVIGGDCGRWVEAVACPTAPSQRLGRTHVSRAQRRGVPGGRCNLSLAVPATWDYSATSAWWARAAAAWWAARAA